MEKIINVAIATDTVLYAPFFAAYYSSDFEDTPYGPVQVNIVARGGKDLRFSSDTVKNLATADGFVIMCLVFGYADIGICDPSLIVHLIEDQDKQLAGKIFEEFQSTLRTYELHDFKIRSNIFNSDGCINLDSLWKIIEESNVKVVGGIVSKMALSAICSSSINDNSGGNDIKCLLDFKEGNIDAYEISKFTQNNINNILQPPSPSTGYCVSELIKMEFVKKSISHEIRQVNYGDEYKIVIGNDYNKYCNTEQQEEVGNECKNKKSVAFTCDYIALDYFKGKDSVIELQDYVKDKCFGDVLYSGLMMTDEAKYTIDEKNSLNAFFYAINKNIYQINDSLLKGRNAVISYLNNKFNPDYNGHYEDADSIMRLMVSDRGVEDKVTIDEAIYFFANRFVGWKENGSKLFYEDLRPKVEDLLRMVKIRQKTYGNGSIIDEDVLNNYLYKSYLEDWYTQEKDIDDLLNKRGIVGFLRNKLWTYLNDDSISEWGSIFIVTQFVSIFLALTGFKIYSVDLYILKPGYPIHDNIMGYFIYFGWFVILMSFIMFVLSVTSSARYVIKLKRLYKYYYRK